MPLINSIWIFNHLIFEIIFDTKEDRNVISSEKHEWGQKQISCHWHSYFVPDFFFWCRNTAACFSPVYIGIYYVWCSSTALYIIIICGVDDLLLESFYTVMWYAFLALILPWSSQHGDLKTYAINYQHESHCNKLCVWTGMRACIYKPLAIL